MKNAIKFFTTEIYQLNTLFTPKEILEQVSDLEIASLRHLNTRREMGIISSSKASEKRGQKNLYDLQTSLIYCIIVELETRGFDIEQAANFAKMLILKEFAHKDNIWLVILYGIYNKLLKQAFLGFYKNSFKSKEQIYKEVDYIKNKYKTQLNELIIINPLPNIFFSFSIDEFKKYQTLLKTIGGIKALEMGNILQKYINKFKEINNEVDEEIGILSRNSIMNYDNPLN